MECESHDFRGGGGVVRGGAVMETGLKPGIEIGALTLLLR